MKPGTGTWSLTTATLKRTCCVRLCQNQDLDAIRMVELSLIFNFPSLSVAFMEWSRTEYASHS